MICEAAQLEKFGMLCVTKVRLSLLFAVKVFEDQTLFSYKLVLDEHKFVYLAAMVWKFYRQ